MPVKNNNSLFCLAAVVLSGFFGYEPVLSAAVGKSSGVRVEAGYEVTSKNMILKLDHNGRISGLNLGQDKIALNGGMRLAGFEQKGDAKAVERANGGMEFTWVLADQEGRTCSVTECFEPTADSIRWSVDIYSEARPWSTSVTIGLKWPVGKKTKFWTAWSDPELIGVVNWDAAVMKAQGWRDPLETRAFADASRWYGGNPAAMIPTTGDYFSIPIGVVIEGGMNRGFSFVQSPEDAVIFMKLITRADGALEFEHMNHRLGGGGHVRFSMDLVSHLPDWRSGLTWMAGRYPQYFNPVNPKALDVGGCGAYSSWEGELDAEKLKKMAFRFNWKASFDFPYMGMFLPPVEKWRNFATYEESARDPWVTGEYKGQDTSIEQLEKYSERMRKYGFYVLNYFNVTEFGTKIKGQQAVNKEVNEDDLWKNSTDFLYTKIADGILRDKQGNDYRTWGDAIVTDCGGRDYKAFLLEQARRHIEKLPASSGICIDRLDWLRLFNPAADDGISWYKDRPARSLLTSWKQLMEKLGPLMHSNDKVIFANPMVSMRLDVLRHIDGIYSEHNEMGAALNASALLGVRKPVVAWTWDANSLQPDPDVFFQRLLYLGVFPTAPVPYNNHTIQPDALADKWYLDYGPLFNALMGRRWLLEPEVIEVSGRAAKANIFEVPGGYSIAVVLADKGVTEATVSVKDTEGLSFSSFTADALQPGSKDPVAVKTANKKGKIIIQVPLKHGCAVVRLKKGKG